MLVEEEGGREEGKEGEEGRSLWWRRGRWVEEQEGEEEG